MTAAISVIPEASTQATGLVPSHNGRLPSGARMKAITIQPKLASATSE